MGMRVALFSDFSLPSLSCAAYTAILAMQSRGLKVSVLTLDPEKNNCAGQEFWSSFQDSTNKGGDFGVANRK